MHIDEHVRRHRKSDVLVHDGNSERRPVPNREHLRGHAWTVLLLLDWNPKRSSVRRRKHVRRHLVAELPIRRGTRWHELHRPERAEWPNWTDKSLGPNWPIDTTYTATAIATAGKVFTATSIVSQAAAQATANAEATAYDAANPTKISKSQTTTVTGASTPTSHPVISTTVTVTNAPDKAKGVVTATLVGPIAKTASGCRATPASAFTKAKRTLYTKAVSAAERSRSRLRLRRPPVATPGPTPSRTPVAPR